MQEKASSMKLKNVEGGRHRLPQEEEYQFISQYQMVSPENINKYNIA